MLHLHAWGLVWTATVAGLTGLAVRDALRNTRAVSAAMRTVIQQHVEATARDEPEHQAAIRKGGEVSLQIIAKVAEIRRSLRSQRSSLDDLMDAVSSAATLVLLQCESARLAGEFRRALRLTTPPARVHGQPARMSGGAVRGESDTTSRLRRANLEAVEQETREAEELVHLIGERLETLLLQVVQIDGITGDLIGSSEARRESAESLERLQRAIDVQRDVAAEISELLQPGRYGTVREGWATPHEHER